MSTSCMAPVGEWERGGTAVYARSDNTVILTVKLATMTICEVDQPDS